MKTMSSEVKLKRCPFCNGKPLSATITLETGATATLDGVTKTFPSGKRFIVSCTVCGANNAGLFGVGFETPEKASDKWNTRPIAEVLNFKEN